MRTQRLDSPPPHVIIDLDRTPADPIRTFPAYGWAGILLIALAEIGLFLRIPPVPHWFFVFVWYGYILAVDGLLYWYEGVSLIKSRFRELLLMLPLSAVCWTIFELFNLRLRNWQYHDLIEPLWLRTIGFALAFATVFPAIFLTADLLRAMAMKHGWGLTRLGWKQDDKETVGQDPPYGWMVVGVVCLILPLAWPRYFFPLVWAGFVLLLDPINARWGLPSLLTDVRKGDPRRIVFLLLGGLVCGGLWEFWNFWAVSKWSYTVPFVGFLKVFEMPILGFLGFPPFALECFCLYYFCSGLRLSRRGALESEALFR